MSELSKRPGEIHYFKPRRIDGVGNQSENYGFIRDSNWTGKCDDIFFNFVDCKFADGREVTVADIKNGGKVIVTTVRGKTRATEVILCD